MIRIMTNAAADARILTACITSTTRFLQPNRTSRLVAMLTIIKNTCIYSIHGMSAEYRVSIGLRLFECISPSGK